MATFSVTSPLRAWVYGGVLAAAYYALTVALAPLSYGPVQFRVAELLKPAALLHPAFALAFGFGNMLANLTSPFGAWDFVAMPLVDAFAAWMCWRTRARPWLAVTVQAVIISLGVAVFPLGLGGGLPFAPSFVSVLLSELVLLLAGYAVIWRWRRWGIPF